MDTLSELVTGLRQELPEILDVLDQGVALFDPTLNIEVCNAAFLGCLDLPPRLAIAGTPLVDILRFQAERGDFGSGRTETLVRRRYRSLKALRRSTTVKLSRNDLSLALKFHRRRDGGLIALCVETGVRRRLDVELAEARTKFRNLIEHSLQGVMIHRRGTIVYVNQAFADLHGYTVEEMLGMDGARIVDPDDLPLINKIRKQSRADPFEMKGVRKDGSRLWLQVVGRDIEWEGGPARQVTVIDITGRKEAEAEMRRQSEIFSQLQEAVIGVALDGTIMSWNDGARRLWGYTADEAIGVHVNMLHGHFQPFSSVDDIVRGLSIQRTVEVEQPFVRKNGDEFMGALRLSLLRDESGAPQSIIGLVIDVTKRRRAEAALRDSEALLRATLDSAINAIITIDESGTIQWVNAAAEQIFGYAAREMAGENIALLMPEDEGRRHAKYMRRYLETGEARIIGVGGRELVGRRRDGSRFPMELGVTKLLHGGRRLFIGVIRDITESKKTERILRQHAAALDHLAEGVLVTDSNTRIIDCNPALERLCGYAKEELIGRSPALLMADPEAWRQEKNRRRKSIRKIGHWQDEVLMRRKDGTEFVCARVLTAFYDDAGKFAGMAGALRDVTEERRTQELLRRQAAVLEQISDAVLVASLDRHIIDCNATACTMFGYDKATMLSMRPWQFAADPEGWQADVVGILREVAEKGRWRGELDLRRRDGSVFAGELTLMPLVDDHGERTGTIGVIRDISERKAAEMMLRQAQKMEAVGQLTGGLAHDFNNILTIVQGNLELLAEAVAGDERLADHAQRAQAATERGAMLIQRLLAFSRKQVLQPEKTEINRLVLDMIDMLADTLHKRIKIRVDLQPDLWPIIVDPSQLENAILNLALNARDAMPDGGTLTFRTAAFRTNGDATARNQSVEPGDYVKLSVVDTGVGMPPEVIEQVFEPFFTTKKVGEGTGLGLSMVYGFVKQSGGFVRIDSTPGEGTQVSLYLPRADTD